MTTEPTTALEACTRALDEYLREQGEALAAEAREPFLVAARDAEDRDEEERQSAILDEVESIAPRVCERCREALVARLRAPGTGSSAGEEESTGDGLSLVETAKVDDWLRLRGMLERQTEGALRVEADLWQRLSKLAGASSHPDGSPVSLQNLCIEFQAAMQGLGPGREARAAIYDAFENTVVENLSHLSAKLSVLLDKAESAAAAASPPAAAAPSDRPDGPLPELDIEPSRLLGAAAAVERREVDVPQFGLDELESRLLDAIIPHPEFELDDRERQTVATVARLVHGVSADEQIDAGVRRRLSLLAPSMLMLALQDESYLLAELEAARHDPVTGLYDRAAFRARLEAACGGSAPVAVCLVDVDGFDEISARFGHQVGGRLLRTLAELLRKQAGGVGVASRLRGDEFAVLFPGANPGDGRRFAERYLVAVGGARFNFAGEDVVLAASIGVVESDAGLQDPSQVMRAAHAARTEAKSAGGGCVRVHVAEG